MALQSVPIRDAQVVASQMDNTRCIMCCPVMLRVPLRQLWQRVGRAWRPRRGLLAQVRWDRAPQKRAWGPRHGLLAQVRWDPWCYYMSHLTRHVLGDCV